jgi:hypothetical protein
MKIFNWILLLELVHFNSYIHGLVNIDKPQYILLNVAELVQTNVIYLDTGEETLMGVEMQVSLMTSVYKGSGSI